MLVVYLLGFLGLFATSMWAGMAAVLDAVGWRAGLRLAPTPADKFAAVVTQARGAAQRSAARGSLRPWCPGVRVPDLAPVDGR
jgi:hypothetical protein